MLDIESLVHEYVNRDRESESGKLWPSSLGSCILREMYRLAGYKETHPMPESTKWKLHRYGWYEKPIADAIAWHADIGACDTILTQARVGNEFWSGKIDVATFDEKKMLLAIPVEVKSISPYAVNKKDLPYKHHLTQAHCYYAILLDMGEQPDEMYIVYISRWEDGDIPTIRQFDVTPTEAELEAVRAEMAEFEYWATQEDLPTCPYSSPSEHPWECMSNFWNNKTKSKPWVVQCPYFGHCWPGYVDPERGYCEEGEESDDYIPF